MGDGPASFPQSITAALRDLYKSMDKGQNLPPLVLLQVLQNAFPRFAERSEHGGYQQQDANECWVELLNMLKQKLASDAMIRYHPPSTNTSVLTSTRRLSAS